MPELLTESQWSMVLLGIREISRMKTDLVQHEWPHCFVNIHRHSDTEIHVQIIDQRPAKPAKR